MKKSYIKLMLLSILLPTSSFSAQTGDSSYNFLKIGVGARAISMGEAWVSIAEGANGMYYNPAGLSDSFSKEITFMHNIYLMDTSQEYLAFSFPLFSGGIGISLNYFGSGLLAGRDENNLVAEAFSFTNLAASAGYGINLLKTYSGNISAGIAVKGVGEWIADYSSSSVALDLGLLARFNSFSIGAAALNLGNAALPRSITAGLSIKLLDNKLLLASGIKIPHDNEMYINAGLEYMVSKLFCVRAGYKYGAENSSMGSLSGITAGCGISVSNTEDVFGIIIDIAMSYFGNLGSTYRFSLSTRF